MENNMESVPSTQKAFMFLDMLRTEGMLTEAEKVTVKQELFKLLELE